jgi:hypothetical protein
MGRIRQPGWSPLQHLPPIDGRLWFFSCVLTFGLGVPPFYTVRAAPLDVSQSVAASDLGGFFSFLRFLLLLLSASLPRGLSLDFDPGTWQWNIDTRSGSFEPHMSGILGLWFRRREAMAWRLVVTDDGGSLMDAAPDHLAAAAGVAAWLWLAGSRWPCRPWFACI